MNKFKLNIIALVLGGLTLASCAESFLDVESKTSSNTGNFYKSKDDAELALIGCYNAWKRTTSDDTWGFYICSELMADECLAGTGVTDAPNYQVVDRFDIGRYSAGTSLLETSWDSYYRAIYRCNEILKYEAMGQFEWAGDETARGRLIGQCCVIRALCYFDMVRLWENIPLLTEPTDQNVPQSDPHAVYATIVEDLKYAIENIPANAYPKAEASANDGRITKYAAEALMARVYLFYTGYYGKDLANVTKDEVVGYLDDIITSKEYKLLPEFKDLWPAASSVSQSAAEAWDAEKTTYKEINDEVILQMKFNYTDDRYNTGGDVDGNRWLVMLGLRKFWYSPYAYGWGCCTVHPKIWNAYSADDARRSASIIDIVGEGIAAKTGFDEYLRDQREYTGYAIKKYTPTCYYNGVSSVPEQTSTSAVQEKQYQPYIVLRYADVLLMAAELGGTPTKTAQDCLDEVRSRAKVPTGVAPTKENIMKERMLEFAFEGIRYWDLLRQGVDYAANEIAESNLTVLSGNQEESITIDAANIKDKRGLMQIPQNQITLSNGLLKQNTGW